MISSGHERWNETDAAKFLEASLMGIAEGRDRLEFCSMFIHFGPLVLLMILRGRGKGQSGRTRRRIIRETRRMDQSGDREGQEQRTTSSV